MQLTVSWLQQKTRILRKTLVFTLSIHLLVTERTLSVIFTRINTEVIKLQPKEQFLARNITPIGQPAFLAPFSTQKTIEVLSTISFKGDWERAISKWKAHEFEFSLMCVGARR